MASPRYTLGYDPKAEPAPPKDSDLAKKPDTFQGRLAYFWMYYKWYVIIGVALLAGAGAILHTRLAAVRPDYQFSIISTQEFTDTDLDVLGSALQPYFDDRNGDGRVVVKVNDYKYDVNGDDAQGEMEAYNRMAAMVWLSGDLQNGDTMIFFVQNFEPLQKETFVFTYLDDPWAAISETDTDYDRMRFAWKDSPVLSGLDLSAADSDLQSLLGDYSVCLRAMTGTAAEGNSDITAKFSTMLDFLDKIRPQNG